MVLHWKVLHLLALRLHRGEHHLALLAHHSLKAREQCAGGIDERAREDIEAFLEQSYKEVIVLVEGIEPTTSCTLQARLGR